MPLHDWRKLRSSCCVPWWFKHAVRLGHGSFLGRRLLQHLVAVLCEAATLALAFTQVSVPFQSLLQRTQQCSALCAWCSIWWLCLAGLPAVTTPPQ